MRKDLPRHTMVIPAAEAWDALMLARPDLAAEPLVREWAGAGRPLVVRQRTESEAPADLPLGLPLPPSHGKRRLSITIPRRGHCRKPIAAAAGRCCAGSAFGVATHDRSARCARCIDANVRQPCLAAYDGPRIRHRPIRSRPYLADAGPGMHRRAPRRHRIHRTRGTDVHRRRIRCAGRRRSMARAGRR